MSNEINRILSFRIYLLLNSQSMCNSHFNFFFAPSSSISMLCLEFIVSYMIRAHFNVCGIDLEKEFFLFFFFDLFINPFAFVPIDTDILFFFPFSSLCTCLDESSPYFPFHDRTFFRIIIIYFKTSCVCIFPSE